MLDKQRLFDKVRPANCRQCGMLIAIAPSKNGVDVKLELDEKSNPTLAPHKCPTATAKKRTHEILSPIKKKLRERVKQKLSLRKK